VLGLGGCAAYWAGASLALCVKEIGIHAGIDMARAAYALACGTDHRMGPLDAALIDVSGA
jgi:hypothetical protein